MLGYHINVEHQPLKYLRYHKQNFHKTHRSPYTTLPKNIVALTQLGQQIAYQCAYGASQNTGLRQHRFAPHSVALTQHAVMLATFDRRTTGWVA